MSLFKVNPNVNDEHTVGKVTYRWTGSAWTVVNSGLVGTLTTSERFEFTATANQTTFTFDYTPGFIDVFLNGVHLDPADYTASNGTTLIMDSPVSLGGELYVIANGNFVVSNMYDKTEVDAKDAGKVNNSRVLTDVPSGALFTDTVYNDTAIQAAVALNTAKVSNVNHPLVEKAVPSNALFTDTVYSKPSAEPVSYITGLQGLLDGKTTESYVDTQINNVVGAAPAALNTLQELGDALGDDANYAATVTTSLAGKVDKVTGKALSTNDYTTAEKNKLSGVADSANNYSHPTTAGNKHVPTGGSVGQVLTNTASGTGTWQAAADQTGAEIKAAYEGEADTNEFSDAEKTKLGGIDTSANNYIHPAAHSISEITGLQTQLDTIAADAVAMAIALG